MEQRETRTTKLDRNQQIRGWEICIQKDREPARARMEVWRCVLVLRAEFGISPEVINPGPAAQTGTSSPEFRNCLWLLRARGM